ncbi:MAG: ATP phosphoribosyltransferase regulatory subunit [Hydrogenophilales bacterium CG03_land_8_20_14_0_80_62_28]|nr:ATP phosphoribosyltransferase regulatory subunit [Betaproteobacteria bacterium]OIO79992.1 MAG: ATP phosphoribosyltransferase regulatory subunit [Hydrogenophilaceae bacterium CG1_02_62_390]PIV22785.1 MAG: ATP phosphoribosyltransferase regulatory subunit [Hydrogenophilales bacterium CG03_land_8_20_14_0_80_62_28]PIW39464.1 MAG: ATP phosphoribosyltransferase regulatory subunit [Hydrogenophilales bacterium CG15_BIG_FIL_POST_REV_8_21_14_020_62_31]PIW72678.1 MAG: ATP phosphoribosyltransferase regul
MTHPWLLPEYVEDILPPYAWQAESLRRQLLDRYDSYGYELVCPPLIEYLDSLLTGAAGDLDLKTFKVVDGLSGRMMGVRADMTPQAARIDAHLLNRQSPTRLCYAGPVLHTRPSGLMTSREPYQVGAELFGHPGIEADREILELLLASLAIADLTNVRVSLGHVGLFRALAAAAGLDGAVGQPLFRALRAKDMPLLIELTETMSEPWRGAFLRLSELYGGPEVIEQARRALPDLPGVTQALDDLAGLLSVNGMADLGVDLADLRGYGYHTGAVFAAYVGGQASAVALGGRYDGAGAVFGRSRPGTGFSLDLRRILASLPEPAGRAGILAPPDSSAELKARMAELRGAGERVVVEFGGGPASPPAETGCNRRLAWLAGAWQVVPL